MLALKEIQFFPLTPLCSLLKTRQGRGQKFLMGSGEGDPTARCADPSILWCQDLYPKPGIFCPVGWPCAGVSIGNGGVYCPKIALGSHSEQNILDCTNLRAPADPSQPQLKLGMFVMPGLKERMVCGFLKPPFDLGVKSTPCTIECE